MATGTGGDILSVLQSLVRRADSSSDNAAKLRAPQHGTSRTCPSPGSKLSCSRRSHDHRQRTSPRLARAVGARRREKTVRSGFIISASNQLLGWTSSTRAEGL